MGIRALRHFGALRPGSVILGVGAGTEVTCFYLTEHVGQVFATDLYLSAGASADVPLSQMLIDPAVFAPYPFDRTRLVVQHMDGRLLDFPDDSFDGIFSFGSIEHFGSLDFIANAAYEMGRVLKPNGVLALATKFKISGPPDGDGWGPDTFILSADRLNHHIVDASGLEPVDPLDTFISEQTMLTKRDLLTVLTNTIGSVDWPVKLANRPSTILVHEGYVFCSIHLALRKSEAYPITDNAWAKPSWTTVAAVEEAKQLALRVPTTPASPASGFSLPAAPGVPAVADIRPPNHLTGLLARWDLVYSWAGQGAQAVPEPLRFVLRTFRRIRALGTAWTTQRALYRGLVEWQLALIPEMNSRLQALKQSGIGERLLRRRLAGLEATTWHLDRTLLTKIESVRQECAQVLQTLSTEIEALDQRIRLNTSYIRLLRQHTAGAQADRLTLPPGEIAPALRTLEAQTPELSQARRVCVSVAIARAELTLLEMTEYFGGRVVAADYSDCDAWYHVDPSSQWRTPQFLDEARAKLRNGSRLVLITKDDPVDLTASGFAFERSTKAGSDFSIHVLKRVE